MQPSSTSASTTLARHLGNHDTTTTALAAHRLAIGDLAERARALQAPPQLTLVGAPVWKHKLILTGRLDTHTVGELEDEIECLCEEGVTTLTLDLRQLEEIDSVGARAIACGGVGCKKRGRDFAVLPGSPVVQRALVEAGAENLLAGEQRETGAAPLAANAPDGPPRDPRTVMVKSL
jgi:anti-anti-sigma factor